MIEISFTKWDSNSSRYSGMDNEHYQMYLYLVFVFANAECQRDSYAKWNWNMEQ
jgi:hypothetical protein